MHLLSTYIAFFIFTTAKSAEKKIATKDIWLIKGHKERNVAESVGFTNLFYFFQTKNIMKISIKNFPAFHPVKDIDSCDICDSKEGRMLVN